MNTTLVAYYVALLLLQYKKPNAQAMVSSLITALMVYDLMVSVRDGYNVENAVGVQLDVLGKYLGPGRVVSGTPLSGSYFGYAKYGDSFPVSGIEGYSVYGTLPVSPGFLSYFDGQQTY